MRSVVFTLVLAGGLLGNLACGHKPDSRERTELPKVAVSLVTQGAPEGGAWVAATLQSTRTAMLSTRMGAQVRRILVQEGQRVPAGKGVDIFQQRHGLRRRVGRHRLHGTASAAKQADGEGEDNWFFHGVNPFFSVSIAGFFQSTCSAGRHTVWTGAHPVAC